MQICKNHKQDKSHSQPLNVNLAHRFKFTIAFFIKKPKILNFIRRMKRMRDYFL